MPLFDQQYSSGLDSEDDEESPDVAQSVVGGLIDEDDVSDELAEAEKRLQKAQYYKVIVLNGVVEENGSQDAVEVNNEAKRWARLQMAKLLGVATPEQPVQKVELPFTPQHISVLIQLAEKAMTMGLVGKATAEPAVKKVTAPAAPTVRKVPAKPVAKPEPMRKVEQTDLRGKPAPSAKAKPTPAPGQTVASGKKKKPIKAQVSAEGELDLESIPTGEVFKDPRDKQLYKMVDNPNFDPSVEGSKVRTKIKVTNQVRPHMAIPIPQGNQMSMITAAQAMETVNSGNSASAASPYGPDEHANPNTFIAAATGALRQDE